MLNTPQFGEGHPLGNKLYCGEHDPGTVDPTRFMTNQEA
jgi:hypothetical protein